ncbi:NAD-dependent protein deacetylase [soil metagenome]
MHEDDALDRARRLVDEAERVVVLTGAGISTDSGIADFRGPNGVWTKNPTAEKTSHISHYVADPEVRRLAWRNRVAAPYWTAEPNAGHRALVELERRGKLLGLLTQNIDELHQRAGSDPALVVELHGTARRWTCLDCEAGGPMEEALERVRAGEEDPACRGCGGILKSATVSFGQALVEADLLRAQQVAEACDLLLAVGSTLTVYPAAGVVPLATRVGARLIVVNGEPTAFDAAADVLLRGRIGDLLPALVQPLESRPHR